MLAVCFIIVYLSLLIIQPVHISGGFNFASVKISPSYFKKLHSSFLSHSNKEGIVCYHLNDLITASNLPASIKEILLNLLIPVFSLSEISSRRAGNNYSLCGSTTVININPLLVYTMRLNCNIENTLIGDNCNELL